jgi:hypothetical protein
MQITDFMAAVAKACSDKHAVTFEAGEGFKLGVAAKSNAADSKAASAEGNGSANLYSDFGAAVVGTGRSDYENQINNVLAFPGIFRGALDARASAITEDMKLAAAYGLASLISDEELSSEYIIPRAFDKRVAKTVAKAVYDAAVKNGVARI